MIFRSKEFSPRIRVSGFAAAKRLGKEIPTDPESLEAFGVEVYLILAWVAWLGIDPKCDYEDFLTSVQALSPEQEEEMLGLVGQELQRFQQAALANFAEVEAEEPEGKAGAG